MAFMGSLCAGKGTAALNLQPGARDQVSSLPGSSGDIAAQGEESQRSFFKVGTENMDDCRDLAS